MEPAKETREAPIAELEFAPTPHPQATLMLFARLTKLVVPQQEKDVLPLKEPAHLTLELLPAV
jgi:hypothetical protein